MELQNINMFLNNYKKPTLEKGQKRRITMLV